MATFGLLEVQPTDLDTDMLSDTAREEIDFDVDLDVDLEVPSAIEDQDDYMGEAYEANPPIDASTDANDAVMLEDYDESKMNERDMYNDVLDEDDQMVNTDFDQADVEQSLYDVVTEITFQENEDGSTTAQGFDEVIQHNAVNSTQSILPQPEIVATEVEETSLLEPTYKPSPNKATQLEKFQSNNSNSTVDASNSTSIAENGPNETKSDEQETFPQDEDLITYDEEDEQDQEHSAVLEKDLQETTRQPATSENIPPPVPVDANNRTEVGGTNKEDVGEKHVDAHGASSVGDETAEGGEKYEEDGTEHDDLHNFEEYSYDIIVQYGSNQLSLFPPFHEGLPEMYLLQDHSLAEKSFTELFTACRDVLDKSISDHDALEMEIPGFELYIHEVSCQTVRNYFRR
jgi:Protein of unknown function (DUF2420)